MFEGWIILSTGKITIHQINVNKTYHAIQEIAVYLVNSVDQASNKRGQGDPIKFNMYSAKLSKIASHSISI